MLTGHLAGHHNHMENMATPHKNDVRLSKIQVDWCQVWIVQSEEEAYSENEAISIVTGGKDAAIGGGTSRQTSGATSRGPENLARAAHVSGSTLSANKRLASN